MGVMAGLTKVGGLRPLPLTAEWREAIVKAGRDGAAERAGSQ